MQSCGTGGSRTRRAAVYNPSTHRPLRSGNASVPIARRLSLSIENRLTTLKLNEYAVRPPRGHRTARNQNYIPGGGLKQIEKMLVLKVFSSVFASLLTSRGPRGLPFVQTAATTAATVGRFYYAGGISPLFVCLNESPISADIQKSFRLHYSPLSLLSPPGGQHVASCGTLRFIRSVLRLSRRRMRRVSAQRTRGR